MSKEITIIGGGIVGVSCALNLQEMGFNPTLIEKYKVGGETSFGNAGVVGARSSIIPLNNPGLLKNLCKYIKNSHPAVRYNASYAVKNIGYLRRFILNSREEKTLSTMLSLDTIISKSTDEHRRWLEYAGEVDRLRLTGLLKVFRKKTSFNNNCYERRLFDDFDIKYRVLDNRSLYEVEPRLNGIFNKGVLINDAASVNNPGKVVEIYAQLFKNRGGEIIYANVNDLSKSSEGFDIFTSRGMINSLKVVVSAGPWSNELLKQFNFRLPMFYERGYHCHFKEDSENSIDRPILDVDGCYVMTSTDLGIRVSSGSELNYRDAVDCYEQINQAVRSAKVAIKIDEKIDNKAWRGSRPTLPDSIPAIGPVPNVDNLWIACGHHHIGFSTGPATGRLIAELIGKVPPFIDPTPFLPSRFNTG